VAAATAHAQTASLDFQVIHLSGVRGSVVNYLAVRSQEDWIKFWERGSLEPPLAGDPPPATTAPRRPPPQIDFSRFILLLAETGVKPSSGYMNKPIIVPRQCIDPSPTRHPHRLVRLFLVGAIHKLLRSPKDPAWRKYGAVANFYGLAMTAFSATSEVLANIKRRAGLE
jgi:hypothetical protein